MAEQDGWMLKAPDTISCDAGMTPGTIYNFYWQGARYSRINAGMTPSKIYNFY